MNVRKPSGFLPNAVEFKHREYCVAQRHLSASDANPGTKTRPFKTISKAASLADMGDTIIIGTGVYREEIPMLRHGHPYMPSAMVTFKAAPGQQVWIRGSDLFEPDWEAIGGGVFRAKLPESLFEAKGYNPYQWSAVVDDPQKVRPCEGVVWPETLGCLFVNNEPLRQMTGLEAVEQTPGSYAITADGREILVRFKGGRVPSPGRVELTMRRRCFQPVFKGVLFMQTLGLDVGQAAEPEAFAKAPPLVVRRNKTSGIEVCKIFVLPGQTDRMCNAIGTVTYLEARGNTLVAVCEDDVVHPELPYGIIPSYTALSEDQGRTWKRLPAEHPLAIPASATWSKYFLDEGRPALFRAINRHPRSGPDLNGTYGKPEHEVLTQHSLDQGQTWSALERIDIGTYIESMMRLDNGDLLWTYQKGQHGRIHDGVYRGCWRADGSGVDWNKDAVITVPPEQTSGGPCELSLCQFADGRVFGLMRQNGQVRPSQEHPGFPSIKFFTVSADRGRTWSAPKPLTDDQGRYIYSPSSMPAVFRSVKNGRVYAMLNICDQPVDGCDPRTTLQIGEIDPERLCLKRATLAMIESRHDQHHGLVRFSNWSSIQDRCTGNLVLFMTLSMSEWCPIRNGYDRSCYRYEIILPA